MAFLHATSGLRLTPHHSIKHPFASLTSFSASNRKVSHHAVQAIRKVYTEFNAAVHQGGCAHDLGRRAAEVMTSSRIDVAQFIGADNDTHIFFSESVSAAVNTIAHSAANTFRRGDVIAVSSLANDDIVIPLQIVAKRRKLRLNFISPNVTDGVEHQFESIAASLTSRTKMVVLQCASQLFCNLIELNDTLSFLKSVGTIVVVDATHAMPCASVDMKSLECDFLIAGGQSFGCPSGATFICGRSTVLQRLPPMQGGENSLQEFTCSSLRTSIARQSSNWAPYPERFEVGMAPLSAAASISAAVKQLAPSDRETYSAKSHQLGRMLYSQLSNCPRISVFGNNEQPRFAAACFTVANIDIRALADELVSRDVFIDFGCHGSRFAHQQALNLDATLKVVLDPLQHDEHDVANLVTTLTDAIDHLDSV